MDMGTIAAMVFLGSVFTGLICVLFLSTAQPVWTIVDVATSDKHSAGTKAILIILTLLLLGPIVTFLYACFGTRSSALRKATLCSFTVLVLAVICACGMGVAMPRAQSPWEHAAKPRPVSPEQQAEDPEPLASNRPSTDEIAPFTALHLVPKDPGGWSVCLAEFTGHGPKPSSAIPLLLPSIYPVSQLAINPDGPVYYAITTHEVGRIVPATGHFVELQPDPALGKPSWPSAIAYDSREGLLLIAARSRGYSYRPSTGEWKTLPGLKDDDLVALAYASGEAILYGLRTKPGGELAIRLDKLSPKGAVLGRIELSRPISVGRYPFPLVQLCWSGARLVALVSAQGDPGARAASSAHGTLYAIDPASGLCRVVVTN
jgi:hypothetical protein